MSYIACKPVRSIIPETVIFPDIPVECKVKLLLEVPKYNLQSLVTPVNGM